MSEVEDLKNSAEFWPRGRVYEEFEVGEVMHHHWGRTITETDTIQFSHLTNSYNPLYFNKQYAKELGHPDIVVNPQLVFNVILGLSVEDCSEILGGPFLGVFDLHYLKPVYPGETLTAVSTTTAKRLSESDPNRGIVTWETKGLNEQEECVVEFKRSNLAVFDMAKKMQEGYFG